VLQIRHLTAIRCPSYARIFHPLSVGCGAGFTATWHWGRLAGRQLSAEITLYDILRSAAESLESQALSVSCNAGNLDHQSATTLTSLIQDGGLAGSGCFFYFWNGLGIFLDDGPHVYQGSVVSAGTFFRAASTHRQTWTPWWTYQSPTLWWNDESWFVATHPDAVSTYVGGPHRLIAEIVQSAFLEAVVANENSLVDDSPLRPGFSWSGKT
jgi:hypothetical protein